MLSGFAPKRVAGIAEYADTQSRAPVPRGRVPAAVERSRWEAPLPWNGKGIQVMASFHMRKDLMRFGFANDAGEIVVGGMP
jgi:hypothetical protein